MTLFVSGVSGCVTSGQVVPQSVAQVAPYMPLARGHQWTYAVRFPGQTGRRTVRILYQDRDGFFVDDSGGAFKFTEGGLRDRHRYLIRAPLSVGRYWNAMISPQVVETYELVSVGEPCECLVGRFEDCLQVVSRIRKDDRVTLQGQFTWARGVGLVKITTSAILDGQGEVPQTEQNLIGYRINGTEVPAPARVELEAREGLDDASTDEEPKTWGR
ncbi:MAG: hypothetical protein KTR25_17940 [Myxococcales bacterium]|nr:hypothetical protein [Myxococcales bacterium]